MKDNVFEKVMVAMVFTLIVWIIVTVTNYAIYRVEQQQQVLNEGIKKYQVSEKAIEQGVEIWKDMEIIVE